MTTSASRSPLIIASIPGRLRLRDPGLRQRLRCEAAAGRLRAIDGVVSVEPNPAAGSVLLRYDVGRCDIAAIEAAAAAVVAALLPNDGSGRGPSERSSAGPGEGPHRQSADRTPSSRSDRATRRTTDRRIAPLTQAQVAQRLARRRAALRWNRYAKLAMLVTLPTSIALAAAGAKKLHIVTGGLFTSMLLLHLTTHRRHLLQ
ncbi:MAG TPA: hypothetical protein PKA20_17685 [Burkholderiaceae bacterium]|nr:hypothetical protein [Burkholderiaceae bacterium]